MSKGIAFLAGLGAGYLDGDRKRRDDERTAKRDARDEEDYQFRKSDRERAVQDRDELRAAAAPAAVESAPIPGPVQDGAAPLGNVSKVGAQHYASQGIAESAAAQHNATDPRERVASTMAAQGNVLGADQLRTSGIHGKAAQMQLDQAMKKMKDEGADRALAAALNGEAPAQVEALYNAQGGNKVSGVRVEPYETTHPVLGKIKTARISGMGSDGQPFEIKDAQAMRFSMFSADKQLDAQFKAKDDVRADKQLGIAQQNANTQEQYRRDQADNMKHQRALQDKQMELIAAGKKKPGEPVEMTLKDARDFESDLNGLVKGQFNAEAGAEPDAVAAMQKQKIQVTALGNSLFRDNAAKGIALTAGTVLQAMELAGNKANVKPMEINGGLYGTVTVHGQPVIVTGRLQPKQSQQPQQAAPQAPAAIARGGVQPVQPAPPGSGVPGPTRYSGGVL